MFGPIKKKVRRRMGKALGRAKPAAAAALSKIKKVRPAMPVSPSAPSAPSMPKGIANKVASGGSLPKGKPFAGGSFNPPGLSKPAGQAVSGLLKKKKKGM